MTTTYKNLYTLVNDQISRKIAYSQSKRFRNQLDRDTSIAPIISNGFSDMGAAELVNTVQDLLIESLPPYINTGLEVVQTDPVSSYVTISSGKGAVGGNLYTLDDDVTIKIPFNSSDRVFFISLYKDQISIEKNADSVKLTLAKIIVPEPGKTNVIYTNKDHRECIWDAYIVGYREYKIYGDPYGRLEEDSLEFLRNNIGRILADNLIGNIKLSEDLTITNVQGTLSMDSKSILLKDSSGNTSAKFDRNGTFFYDSSNREIARFSRSDAKIGNIQINVNSIQSVNFISGLRGFQILDNGNIEFNNGTFRGTLYADEGEIGGFTIASNKLYGGTIQTDVNVEAGVNGVVMDSDGLRVYDDILGLVVNLPSDGSAPIFSSGTINEVIFEISTNSVLRTSETVGDGTANSYGILINNTGIYGCAANQTLGGANLKALINGNVYLSGEVIATSGQIGGFTIESDRLTGGLIEGTTIRSAVIETSDTLPKIRIDENGIYYQVTTNVGKYGPSGSGLYGFKYGDGTLYGAGVTAYLFRENYPILSILQEQDVADIRLYNRISDPSSGTHTNGDIICVSDRLKICTSGGSPGTFGTIPVTNDDIDYEQNQAIQFVLENRTSDPGDAVVGQIWFRTDI